MSIQARKQREFLFREQLILNTALELFAENDLWLSVTVEQIAKQAEIGKGTVYKHFASKEEIYARLALNFFQAAFKTFANVDQGNNAIEWLQCLTKTGLYYHLEHHKYEKVIEYCWRLNFRNNLSNTALKEAFDEVEHQFLALFNQIISQGIEEGVFPQQPINDAFYGIQATFDGALLTLWSGHFCQHHDNDESIDIDEYIDSISRYMVAGIVGACHIPSFPIKK